MNDLIKLNDCSPGLFLFNGSLCFKSEYTSTLENPRRYQCDAYVASSGEYFHGGAKSTEERGNLMVLPVSADRLTELEAEVEALRDRVAYLEDKCEGLYVAAERKAPQ